MVRDDEDAAKSLGKPTARIKMQAMMLGSALAAVAGVLYAFYAQFVGTEDFIPYLTFLVLAMVILGGAANNRGVLWGVLLLTAVDRLTRPSIMSMLGLDLPFDVTYARYAFVGLLLTVLVMYRPQGLFPERPLATPAWEVLRRHEKR
jgi:branched-chain amino acid transport system permease protein